MPFNSKLKKIWQDLPLGSLVPATVGVNLFSIAAILAIRNFLPPQVPLFYGEPVGEEQLVGSLFLILAPVFSLAVVLINTFLASKINDDFMGKVLIISSVFVSGLSFITVAKIIFLVGSF